MQRLVLIALFLLMTACSPESQTVVPPIKVEISKTAEGYVLLRGGEPYVVKGAVMGRNDIERFAGHGGNSYVHGAPSTITRIQRNSWMRLTNTASPSRSGFP